MATRIDYKVSITPIEATGAGGDGGPVQVDAISYNFQKSLGGGNSSLTWAGTDSIEWSNGVNTMITAAAGVIDSPAACNGIWVKNSGLTFADQTVKASAASRVQIIINTKISAVLGVGEGMFFPSPYAYSPYITLAVDAGDTVAVEYAIFK